MPHDARAGADPTRATPALYRYFASRDELLADLAVDIHLALADALAAASVREASACATGTA